MLLSVEAGPGLLPRVSEPSRRFVRGVAAGWTRLAAAFGAVRPNGVLDAAVVLAELMSEPEPNLLRAE